MPLSMRKSFLLAILLLMTTIAFAQKREISGFLVDSESKEPLSLATVQLLKMDSTFISGALSNDSGKFVIQARPTTNICSK